MPARTRLATTIALTATLTAGTAALLTGCGPSNGSPVTGSSAAGGSATAGTATGTASADAGGPGSGTASAMVTVPANGVDRMPAGLTVSDGSRYVLIDGARVDFGTPVKDLAWSPDGRKAAFIDGAGDLAVADPDGGARVTVARVPGGQTWSHPTWQVAPEDSRDGVPAKDDLLFAARRGGVSRLDVIPATAVDGTPRTASLNHQSGQGVAALPQTGNVWPSAGGTHGTSVYANVDTGEVYIRDDSIRQQGSPLTPGSEPAMSPGDEEEIVFVRSVGGHDHLFLDEPDGPGTPKDLTPRATTDYTEPAWSPDGGSIAARTPAGVVVLPVSGARAPVRAGTATGLPAYRS